MLEHRPQPTYLDQPLRGGPARIAWVRISDHLPPGVLLCHEGMVGGWMLRAELHMTNVGSLQLRVNGVNHGAPMMDCTMAHGRKQYQALLKRLARPRQLVLPL